MSFYFVSGEIEEALRRAKRAAGDKDVRSEADGARGHGARGACCAHEKIEGESWLYESALDLWDDMDVFCRTNPVEPENGIAIGRGRPLDFRVDLNDSFGEFAIGGGEFAEAGHRGGDDFEGFVDLFLGGQAGEGEADAGSGASWGKAHGGEDVRGFGRAGLTGGASADGEPLRSRAMTRASASRWSK